MENNHRRRRPKNNSGDKFSFPVFPLVEDHGSGCASDHPLSPNSPADHLFFNGRLLPHAFPCQPTTNTYSFSRSTSITSSVSSSKDSFLSSRSNSSNSRSSSCSSARTSTGTEAAAILLSERKLLTDQPKLSSDWYGYRAKKPVLTSSTSSPHYGSSRRWQFIIPAPPPILKNQHHHLQQQQGKGGSSTRKVVLPHHESGEGEELKYKKKAKKLDWTGRGTWFGWRFFRSLMSACKECHAMKPSPRNYPPN